MDTGFSSPQTTPASTPSRAASPKALWGAIGALAVGVAVLGGTLLYQHGGRPSTGAPPVSGIATPQPLSGPEDGGMAPSLAAAPPAGDRSAPVLAPAQTAQTVAPATVVGGAAPPEAPVAPAARAAPPSAPVCAVCGRVESVQTVRRAAPATGVGAVAGGVLGGVLGNQIGHGGGRTAATVIGAVGGGYAGHTIEQRTRTETRYQVRVRMADGSLRTVETRNAPPIGKPVTLKGQVLRPADGRA